MCAADTLDDITNVLRSGNNVLNKINNVLSNPATPRSYVNQSAGYTCEMNEKGEYIDYTQSDEYIKSHPDSYYAVIKRNHEAGMVVLKEARQLASEKRYDEAMEKYKEAYSLVNSDTRDEVSKEIMQIEIAIEQEKNDQMRYADMKREEERQVLVQTMFGGIRQESSIVDVINTLKKMDTIKNIQIGYYEYYGPYMQLSTFKKGNKNFKTSPSDATSILNTIGNLLSHWHRSTATFHTGQGQYIDTPIYVIADKIYIENIPFDVMVKFKPSAAYYYVNPSKVLKGASGTIYSYVLDDFALIYEPKDITGQSLIRANGGKIVKAYNDKYGDLINDYVYVQDCGEYIKIYYGNKYYEQEIEQKFQQYFIDKASRQNSKYNSVDKI